MSRKNNGNGINDSNINTKDLSHRIDLMEKYIEGKITAQKVADILGLKIRQVWNLIRNYKEVGKLSLIHNLTNKPSNHSIEKETKEKVLELIKQDKYKDFGPTLLSEYLKKYENTEINHETLRL
jgi:Glu-tRNA(Gln) amidotransferase subunit E-like FAD-binding protein